MLAVLWLTTTPALGGDVTVEISSRETYVDTPVTLKIIFTDAQTYNRPEAFEIAGAQVSFNPIPSRQSYTRIFNGQTTTTNTIIYEVRITPTQEGLLRIPSLTLIVDGLTTVTQPIEVLVSRRDAPVDTSELLLIDIEAARDTYYLGEAVQVTLRIWVRPYRDQTYNITVSRSDMWRMVNREMSSWDEFQTVIDDLNRTQFPGFRDTTSIPEGGEELRLDESGSRHSYYHYELPATIWPKQAGTLLMNDVKVIIDYPTRIQRRRSLL
ncbi:MAG: BatD family protein, partial [Chloroflexi bacterium]|nr:BatD family protein [Chloroflexota bacterium]